MTNQAGTKTGLPTAALAIHSPTAVELLDHLGAGVLWVDGSGQVQCCNRSLRRMLGLDPEQRVEVIGDLANCFRQPANFLTRAQSLVSQGLRVSEAELATAQDRLLLLDFTPILSGGHPVGFLWQFTDVTEASVRRRALEDSEEKYRSVITNMNLGLLEVDLTERIRYVNRSFCQICGYSEQELLGQVPSTLFQLDPETLGLMRGKNQSRVGGFADVYEIPVTVRSGRQRWWAISGAPLYNHSGEIVGSIGIHLDVTEQKRAEFELRDAKRRADESARASERFVATMSHEIRTPLSGISGLTQLLERTDPNPQQREYLTTIEKAISLLQRIVDDILDLSKLDAGQLALQCQPFSLRDELLAIHRMHQPRAAAQGLAFLFDFDSRGMPVRSLGDSHRISQVISNLLGNAIKFTERGSVRLSCRRTGGAPSVDEVELVVTDTGIGMAPDFIPSLFKPFAQENGGQARRYGGTGLGMNISRRLVELMSGEISVTSERGVGTSVTVRLPLRSCAPDLAQSAVPEATAILVGKRVLLAEDNDITAMVVSAMLTKEGALLTRVRDGGELINEVGRQPYDLVISDMEMPVLSGLDAVRWIRSNRKEPLRIIALTANVLPEEGRRCLAAGFDAVLHKPFRRDALLRICN
jgi:PAS domain S-box-containing protein